MGMTVHVDIVSAESAIFSGTAKMVHASGVMGELGILPRHSPLLTKLKPGQIRVDRSDGEEEYYYVSGGMLEVQPHCVTVLADTVIRAKDLDEAAALQAKERAEQLLKDKQGNVDLAQVERKLIEALAQLQTIETLRNKHR
jgi:F-type H+-transporting ATPase subunit epsilon